ncbi:MAG TPA: methyltransferase domain-containing protein [Thermoanaerobaculia bacterium]
MRRAHFDALRPVCVVCRAASLSIAHVVREEDDDLLEGILQCTNAECQREYPVIDGIPVLVGPIRAWLAANPLQVLLRDDLSPELESLLGDVLGAGSAYDTLRQHTGMYAEDHYATHSARKLLDLWSGGGQAILPVRTDGTVRPPLALDVGCATGGVTFAIAERTNALTLGVDLNFAMLRVASKALRAGRVRFARRRVGIVYDRREIDVQSNANVDFWCCDATALPFANDAFQFGASLNIVDCVSAPREALRELARVVNGEVLVATPYDWAPTATPVEGWLGGHSQRGTNRGASEPVLHALLRELGLEIVRDEPHVPWRVRLHERSSVDYDVHAIVAKSAKT